LPKLVCFDILVVLKLDRGYDINLINDDDDDDDDDDETHW